MPTRLLGRDGELARLRALVAPDPDAHPRLVVVEGEAGIGKTTVVRAAADGMPGPVRWAQGVDDGAPPFWVWRQLVPEVEPGDDRFARHVALRAALVADGGCLLVVDDVQWADEPSLRALRALLRDPGCRGMVCCATRRSGESGPGWDEVGADLLAGADVDRMVLAGLPDGAAAEVLRAAAGGALDAVVERDGVAAAGGNPLFLRELGRLAGVGGAPAGDTVASVIVARVRRLDPAAQRLLSAASILAVEFELPAVARLLDVSTIECLPPVTSARAAGLLLDAGTGRFRFAHGLVRSALAAELPLQRSVALHARAAAALEDLHRDGLADVSAEIARHWAAVAVTGERAHAVAWARRAGDDAARDRAHEEAARLYRSALACGGGTLTADERAELLVALGAAEVAAGSLSAAFATCTEAVAAADAAGRPDLVAGAALTLDAVGDSHWDRTLVRWCRSTLDGLDGAHPDLRVRLLARLAEARFYGGDVTGAAADAATALAAATDAGPDAVIAALRARQLTCSGPAHTAERSDLATRMTATGERLGRPDVEMWGRLWTVDVCWERGDLAGIAAETARLRWCAEQQRSPLARWHLLVTEAALAQARGRLDEALDLGGTAARLMSGTGHAAVDGAWFSLLAAIGHHRGHDPASFGPPGAAGDTGEVRAALFARLGPAFALAESGRLDEARHLYRLTGPPAEWDVPPYFTLPALATGATIAVLLDLRADVAWFRGELDRHRGGHTVGGGGVASYMGPVDLHIGRCAAALDDLGVAAERLAAAIATCERIGAPGFAVEAMCELAAVRLRQRAPDAARALLVRARPDAERLGMAPWLARIDARLAGGAGPLTAREHEIAELVALGRSNREIADALVLSHRTVGNHVQHILTKLGVGNRSQITAWVLARGMSSDMSTSPGAPQRRTP